MLPIRTSRLRLIPLDASQLEELRQDRVRLEQRLKLQPSTLQCSPEMAEEIAEAMTFWLQFTRSHPEIYYWGTNWEIVLESEQRTIGGIGLGGPPNRHGQVTVGYHIDLRRHGHGYATEALGALRDWALAQEGCNSMVAFTPVENIPSQRVLTKCGFEKVEQVEESGIACFFWRYPAVSTG